MISIENNANLILEKLEANGYEAYIVGGCVRDSLLQIKPQDWDICTDALPQEVMSVFKNFKLVPTGLKHGTVGIILDGKIYETTTYRIDGKYLNNRKPEEVIFTSSLKEDLSRRDFTINSLAYNEKDGLVDYFQGYEHLKKRSIKAVGNPKERFEEDALRMLRAIRFACQLNFKIEEDTLKAIEQKAPLLKNISKERIRDEFSKILLTDYPSRGIKLLLKAKLLEFIAPELIACIGFNQHNPCHDKDVFNHTLAVLDNTPKKLVIRLAALLHDIGKPHTFSMDEKNIGHFYGHHLKSEVLARGFLERLRFDNKTIERVSILVREHMSKFNEVSDKGVKRLINRVGVENVFDLFTLQIADIKGCKPRHDFNKILKVKSRVEKILNNQEPLMIKDLKVTGYDLMDIGISPGAKMGEILEKLLQVVLEKPELNDREKLLKIANKIKEAD